MRFFIIQNKAPSALTLRAFKFLGVLMEAINITPKEIRKTMWTAAAILFLFAFIWNLPELITAIRWW